MGRRVGESSRALRGDDAPSPRRARTAHQEERRSDYTLHKKFPFMAPVFLWKAMSAAGFFVFVFCTLLPPNSHAGGSQLNAAMTLFQSVILWKAAADFSRSAKRTLCLSCFMGYAHGAGVTLSDIFLARASSPIETLLWTGSSLIFYLAAQASMVYVILDNEAVARKEGVGILDDEFHFEDLGGGGLFSPGRGPRPLTVVAKAFSRTFLLTLLSLSAAVLGKRLHEMATTLPLV
ncbi:hypothetical protein HOP50_04g27950 [Chloropicon primus]|uniref:Uncharacterized protein n=1 Tax=Chloropicon primus TaxID=1764295 RepID=A0A5B8MI23_9CHLO|nr:hypothetical protein A3770_04p27960 [Chloropicon primus]UPQ99487.1 hypothetical protein HOP50_04g27950 [Chloropicon primus]|eukprot:QDZ20278.1 hypothetical protein A3770_04p27960 [Chloropicon primus]